MLIYTTIAILLLALFPIGLGIGYIYSRDSTQTQTEKLRATITVVVTLVWVAAMAADIAITGYTVSPFVHAIMGAVVGYFFADKGLDVTVGG